ncbi:MAG TPA: 4-hydroxythreonine-4-phosphate dehydrogenase PdxA [Hellea balneolensis]|uniref:4-hydroxythreonine-4-phosphate dehydrogenase n=1 Tax=Hellea balneolensis TaxID=287478 RepID=A0A7V5NWB2_9PROT|nr:4-hydroxythreonine-4-phosphate dehydrogenase PdxA [Hellea balneolensis]
MGPGPLAVTMGDPAGIGPEITTKAWLALRDTPYRFFVIADPGLYPNIALLDRPEQAAARFADALPVLPIDSPAAKAGKPDAGLAGPILKSIKYALRFAENGQAAGIITNPIAKHVLYEAGFSHPGHTEFLADLTNTPLPVMMLSARDLNVALVTIHMALKDVANSICAVSVINTARILDQALRRDFGISSPRIAMCGLNPHAGENGALGDEEQNILIPAAQTLRAEGINITNPKPADTMFHAEAREEYDAALAMYHDQGLIPVKSLDFHGGVNTTLGLPVIRTSPDHGTAFDIAGKDIARPDSLIAAIKQAAHMAACRKQYDAGHA